MTKSSKPNPTILSRLDEPTRQQAEGESVEVYRLRLQRQASKHLDRRCCAQVDANLDIIQLGLNLIDEQPPKGDGRGAWQVQAAKALGIKARQLRTYISAAEVIREADGLAVALPIELLDRPLDKVARAVMRHAGWDRPTERKVSASETARRRSEAALAALLPDIPDAAIQVVLGGHIGALLTALGDGVDVVVPDQPSGDDLRRLAYLQALADAAESIEQEVDETIEISSARHTRPT